MLGFDIVVLALSACCAWMSSPLEFLTSQRPEALNEAVLKPMQGRRVAIELGQAYTEQGMTDPAGAIANPLAASLAERYGLKFEPGTAPSADGLVLGMHTLEWLVVAGTRDYQPRYPGQATLRDRSRRQRPRPA